MSDVKEYKELEIESDELKELEKYENEPLLKQSLYFKKIYPILPLVTQFKIEGKSDKQIYSALGVTQSTWCRWKKKYKTLENALNNGEETLDMQIESLAIRKILTNPSTKNNGLIQKILENRHQKYSKDVSANLSIGVNKLEITIEDMSATPEQLKVHVADIEK